MTYEELRIDLDIYDPEDVLKFVGKTWYCNLWFVVCDEGDCHMFKKDGTEDDIHNVTIINELMFSSIALKKIIIPDSIEYIADYAFRRCYKLTDIVIPDSVTCLGHSIFSNCSNLENVTLSNSIKTIPLYTFEECTKIENIVIPANVHNIQSNAFCNCRNLKNLTFVDKTMDEVNAMMYHPWGIKDKSIIKCC